MKQQLRTNYDETFCGKLPLNQTNMIQPHGVLILLEKNDFKIIQVSENVSSLLNMAPSDVFDRPLKDFLTGGSYQNFLSLTTSVAGKMPTKLFFTEEKECIAIVQEKPDYFMVEVELPQFFQQPSNNFLNAFPNIRELMEKVNNASTIMDICNAAAREIKNISGFDKVMIYAFDEQWNGDVVAEAREEDMDEYLGLKFPASDIPKPARDMYLKNPYRIIPNSAYEAMRLYPLLNPATNSFTDLGEADLRSVASVHLEYLKNMKVVASMSTRIVDGGKLWGLIACHHKTAKYLSFEQCSVFELLSGIISSKISSLHANESFASKELLHEQLNRLINFVRKEDDPLFSLFLKKQEIQKLLSAEGLAICWNGTIETAGECPNRNELDILLYWLQGKATKEVYAEAALPFVFEEAGQYADVASGIIALPLSAAKGNYIIGFRPEVVKQVGWGGNPDEAVSFEENSTRYHPRNSFTLWKEIVRGTARPWTMEEIESAEKFRKIIVELLPKSKY